MSEEERNRPEAEDEEYEPDLLTLEDEDGEEHTFEVIDAGDLDDVRYLAMTPYYEDPSELLEAEAELLFMRVGEEDGEEYLDLVEDKDEFARVGGFFAGRLQDVFEIDMEELREQLEAGEGTEDK